MSLGSSSSGWSIKEVLQIAFSTKSGKKKRADSTIRQWSRTSRTASQSLYSVGPCKCKTGEERDTKAHRERSKDDIVPALVSPYPPTTCKGAVQPNRKYHLSPLERSLLEKVWTEYHFTYDCLNLLMSSNEIWKESNHTHSPNGMCLLFAALTVSLKCATTSMDMIFSWFYAGTRSTQHYNSYFGSLTGHPICTLWDYYIFYPLKK